MKKISQEQITSVCEYLSNSIIPAKDAIAIMKMLQSLPDVTEKKEKSA